MAGLDDFRLVSGVMKIWWLGFHCFRGQGTVKGYILEVFKCAKLRIKKTESKNSFKGHRNSL